MPRSARSARRRTCWKSISPTARSAGSATSSASADAERSHPVALAPDEALDGVAERGVFAADPAGVAQFVDAAEDKVPADLAGARLVAAGDVGQLHVVD